MKQYRLRKILLFKTDDLKKALFTVGDPVTPAELKNRFEQYLDKFTEDKEAGKVRLVLE